MTTPPRSGRDLRQAFIAYFRDKLGHKVVHSASLVPTNPTVLLTPAGMLPFVPIFLGIEPAPNPPRLVSSQKCARVSGKASDLAYVGRTPRHHTFFEMLGNFSFGDYFKAEVIPWAWAFVTDVLQLPAERLWVSVHHTDDESAAIWRDAVGVPAERIVRRGDKDNFWGPPGPTGPCGPCTEIYVDLGPSYPGEVGDLDADRYVEIWNLVLMEFFQDDQGRRAPLEKKNVDTGMGLERLALVMQEKPNTFETDLLFPILQTLSTLTGVRYGASAEGDVALKIVTDHARCVTFALADGIVPSNEGRGYVIRMILRRAVRYGKTALGCQEPILYKLVDCICQEYGDAYPELTAQKAQIAETIQAEEARFFQTLDRGSRLLDELLQRLKAEGQRVVPGEDAFRLYDTYGFPLELTADIAEEAGLTIDEPGFEAAMAAQRDQARSARKGAVLVKDQVYAEIREAIGPTQFLGYDSLQAEATVKALLVDGQPVSEVSGTNAVFECILDRTPFYGESGGQVGDRGAFSREAGPHGLTVVVNDTVKVGDLFIHRCLFDNGGTLRVGETLLAQVEPVYRQLSAIHHTSTHLLQSALRSVLGPQVTQAGSHVSPDGARFDFTFPRALTPEEVQRVEATINRWVLENLPRTVQELPFDEAKALGAIVMAGEAYGDLVRVVAYGDRSMELCGGTHLERLGDIGLVKIVSESAIASGVRRIELVAGEMAYKLFKQQEAQLQRVAGMLKTPVRELPERVDKLLDAMKQQEKRLQALEGQIAHGVAERLMNHATPPDGLPAGVILEVLSDLSPDGLKAVAEHLAARLPSHVVLLGLAHEGKAQLVAAVSKDWNARGVQAGALVKTAASLCGGGGGGKPNFATAGGKDPSRLPEALGAVAQQLSAALQPAG